MERVLTLIVGAHKSPRCGRFPFQEASTVIARLPAKGDNFDWAGRPLRRRDASPCSSMLTNTLIADSSFGHDARGACTLPKRATSLPGSGAKAWAGGLITEPPRIGAPE
jgi:hypothetical protein